MSAAPLTQVAEDLRAAADVLERDHWQQFGYGGLAGPKCVWGALYYVVTGGRCATDRDSDITGEEYDRAHRAGEYLIGYLDAYGRGWPARRLIVWNDALDRTEEQVVAVLQAAADAAEEATGVVPVRAVP